MAMLAGIFALIGGVVAWFGFSNAGTDTQLTFGVVGMFFAVTLFVLGEQTNRIEDINYKLKEKAKPRIPRKQRHATMNDALEEYRKSLPGEVTGDAAIRRLVTERLKEIGYLT